MAKEQYKAAEINLVAHIAIAIIVVDHFAIAAYGSGARRSIARRRGASRAGERNTGTLRRPRCFGCLGRALLLAFDLSEFRFKRL